MTREGLWTRTIQAVRRVPRSYWGESEREISVRTYFNGYAAALAELYADEYEGGNRALVWQQLEAALAVLWGRRGA